MSDSALSCDPRRTMGCQDPTCTRTGTCRAGTVLGSTSRALSSDRRAAFRTVMVPPCTVSTSGTGSTAPVRCRRGLAKLLGSSPVLRPPGPSLAGENALAVLVEEAHAAAGADVEDVPHFLAALLDLSAEVAAELLIPAQRWTAFTLPPVLEVVLHCGDAAGALPAAHARADAGSRHRSPHELGHRPLAGAVVSGHLLEHLVGLVLRDVELAGCVVHREPEDRAVHERVAEDVEEDEVHERL